MHLYMPKEPLQMVVVQEIYAKTVVTDPKW